MKKFMVIPGKIIIEAAAIKIIDNWIILCDQDGFELAVFSRDKIAAVIDMAAAKSGL